MQYACRSACLLCIATAASLLFALGQAPLSPAQEIQFMSAECSDCGPGYSAQPWGPGGTLYWDDGCTTLGNCNYAPLEPMRARCRFDASDIYTAPVWYFAAEAAPLYRDADVDGVVFSSPAVALTASAADFDHEFQTAARLTAGRTLAPDYRLEFTYLSSNLWSDQLFFDDGAETLDVEFGSRMIDLQLNLRQRLPLVPARYQASMLYGVRFMEINESLAQTAVGGGGAQSIDVNTGNDLIGFQIGLLGQFLARDFDRWWIDAETKGTIAHNTADHLSLIDGAITGEAQEQRTAFIGEVSVVANYRILSWLTVRLGYQAMWVTGVAIAEDNYVSALAVGPDPLDHSGVVVYHGPVAGLSGAW